MHALFFSTVQLLNNMFGLQKITFLALLAATAVVAECPNALTLSLAYRNTGMQESHFR